MRILVAMILMLSALSISLAEPATTPSNVIRIEALIDGRSRLLLKGKTAQWLNLEYAAPGRHDQTKLPTVLNGKKWFPEWPDQPDEENRRTDANGQKA